MMQHICVIGAGQMGGGIAQVCAQSGYQVTLVDNNSEQLSKAITIAKKSLDKLASKEKLSEADKNDALSRLNTTTNIADAKAADVFIEAATESMSVKAQILTAVAEVCSNEALLASNTSSISITQLGQLSGVPERFLGLHFMNPVPVMKLVEIIRGTATSNTTYEQGCELITSLGKTIVTAMQDRPGFIVNRILMPMINEAAFVFMEGIGSAEDIDQSMRLGTNHPMGPLQLADFIGLDTCLAIMEVLYNGFNDSKYRPCPVLKNYVDAGWLGKKAGRGFYNYN